MLQVVLARPADDDRVAHRGQSTRWRTSRVEHLFVSRPAPAPARAIGVDAADEESHAPRDGAEIADDADDRPQCHRPQVRGELSMGGVPQVRERRVSDLHEDERGRRRDHEQGTHEGRGEIASCRHRYHTTASGTTRNGSAGIVDPGPGSSSSGVPDQPAHSTTYAAMMARPIAA